MIEVIYKEEKQEAKGNEAMFSVPRNIRQIGLINEDYRIYIEDYVYTFLGRLAGSDKTGENAGGCLAVLMGDTKWSEGTTYLFVRGALMVEEMEAAADHIDFTEEIWTKIHEEKENYFPEQEVVGWFFSQPQLSIEMTEVFTRTHLKHFGGEKVLMLMDPVEREDAFFRYESSFMVRQSGYYIYYEKNPLMQAYMIEKNQEIRPEPTEEVDDEAVKSFRKIINAKKKQEVQEEEEERPSIFSYAATACLAVAILAVGVNFYHNYRDMQSVSRQAEAVSSAVTEKKEISDTPALSAAPKADASGGEGKTASAPKVSEGRQAGQDAQASRPEKSAENQKISQAEKPAEEEEPGQSQQDTQTRQDIQDANTGRTKNQEAEEGLEASPEKQDTQAEDAGKQESAKSGNTDETAADEVYQEESDVRKAKRREAQANQDLGEDGQQAVSGSKVHESYVIRPGDTLFQISMSRYGSMEEIEEICKLNGISEEEIIYPGQVIVLP